MRQIYNNYTQEDHQVWSIMYQEQIQVLKPRATQKFLEGMKQIHFKAHMIPDFEIVNKALSALTGWQVYAVPGIIDNKPLLREEMILKSNGKKTVPQIFFGDSHIGGYDDLKRIYDEGKISSMIGKKNEN